MLVSSWVLYTTQVSSGEFGVLPFAIGELFCPRTLVFVNVEAHSKATPKQVADEWNIINKSLQMQIKMITNNKLQKLTSTVRNVQKMQNSAASLSSNKGQTTQKAKTIKFKKTPPTTIDLPKILKKII